MNEELRDTDKRVLASLLLGPKSWTELEEETNISKGGLHRVISRLLKKGYIKKILKDGKPVYVHVKDLIPKETVIDTASILEKLIKSEKRKLKLVENLEKRGFFRKPFNKDKLKIFIEEYRKLGIKEFDHVVSLGEDDIDRFLKEGIFSSYFLTVIKLTLGPNIKILLQDVKGEISIFDFTKKEETNDVNTIISFIKETIKNSEKRLKQLNKLAKDFNSNKSPKR